MWDFVAQKTVEMALGFTKDWLKQKIDARNTAALERKKKDAEARRRQERAKALNSLKNVGDDRENSSAANSEEVLLLANEEAQADLDLSVEEVRARISSHLRSIEQWCSSIGFADMRGTKATLSIYIELDTFLTPSRLHMDRLEKGNTIPIAVATAKKGQHCIILGQPGAGKTTTMKKLCLEALGKKKGQHHHALPILIRFKDLPSSGGGAGILVETLSNIFGFSLTVGGALLLPREALGVNELRQEVFVRFLDELEALIILDGFDELSSNEMRVSVASEIRMLAFHLTKSKLIVTCRTGEFNYVIDNSAVFEIASLSMQQISEFAVKWLGEPEKAQQFLDEISRSPFGDTAIKPLALAHLCAIYERIGRIPEKPKTIYRKIVSLYLEEWDEQRSVRRISRYAGFDPDRKFEFLSHLAFYLTTQMQSLVFTTQDLLECYNRICVYFALDRKQANMVISEIESHTGLFIQVGYEYFEFVHKSVQEYLTAEYIVRLPSVPSNHDVLSKVGAELAIASSISSNPTQYLTHLGLNVLKLKTLPQNFWNSFVNRLVIEKPDLYSNDSAAIAMYALLSGWQKYGTWDLVTYNSVISLLGTDDVARAVVTNYSMTEPKAGEESVTFQIKNGRQNVKFGEGKHALPATLLIPIELRAFRNEILHPSVAGRGGGVDFAVGVVVLVTQPGDHGGYQFGLHPGGHVGWQQGLCHAGIGGRGDGIETDVVFRALEPQHVDQTVHRHLRRAVIRLAEIADGAGAGCRHHNPAIRLLAHDRPGRFHAIGGAEMVHLVDEFVVLQRHVVERLVAQDAGVADQGVDPAPGVHGGVDDALCGGFLGDRGVAGDRFAAGGLDLRHHFVGDRVGAAGAVD